MIRNRIPLVWAINPYSKRSDPVFDVVLGTPKKCNNITYWNAFNGDFMRPSALETITNSNLDKNTWFLSSLPVRTGEIGVRKIQDIALPAFLSSVNAVSPFVSTLLHDTTLHDTTLKTALEIRKERRTQWGKHKRSIFSHSPTRCWK